MNISIVTLFPDLYGPFLSTSLVKRAHDEGLIESALFSLMSYAAAKERIDGQMYGHGPGMLIKPTVIQAAVEDCEKKYGKAHKVFFSPHGEKITQSVLERLLTSVHKTGHLLLLPSRYEGMDARVEEYYADDVFSLGDFVLMGGDIPAMALLEGLLRLIPGVVGKQESVIQESFQGPFLDYPSYTAPVEWNGMVVPDILRSGNHKEINVWRQEKAIERTLNGHFDWLRAHELSSKEKEAVRNKLVPHYAALMHTDVLIGNDRVQGTTSVTSLDIHDIARSAKTYGLEHYFIVTPLVDQQKVVQQVLDFWHEGPGRPYNPNRYEAVKQVSITSSIGDVCAQIEKIHGVPPVVVATSAVLSGHDNRITFHDQKKVWAHNRPVLFVFGTGRGLTPSFVSKADYLLVPLEGLTDFNHLSVRSAAAIVFDKWLGLNVK